MSLPAASLLDLQRLGRANCSCVECEGADWQVLRSLLCIDWPTTKLSFKSFPLYHSFYPSMVCTMSHCHRRKVNDAVSPLFVRWTWRWWASQRGDLVMYRAIGVRIAHGYFRAGVGGEASRPVRHWNFPSLLSTECGRYFKLITLSCVLMV